MEQATVSVTVTHSNLKATFPEIRFSLQSGIAAVKEQLWRRTGTTPSCMKLSLQTTSGVVLHGDLSDELQLGYYQPKDGQVLHVTDTDPTSLSRGGQLEETANVDKYVMPDSEYEQRDETLRKFKQKLFLERPDLEEKAKAGAAAGH